MPFSLDDRIALPATLQHGYILDNHQAAIKLCGCDRGEDSRCVARQ